MLNTSVARGDLTSRSREEELDKFLKVNIVEKRDTAKDEEGGSPVKAGGNVDLN